MVNVMTVMTVMTVVPILCLHTPPQTNNLGFSSSSLSHRHHRHQKHGLNIKKMLNNAKNQLKVIKCAN